MNIARQTRSIGEYFAGGIACGLGGMLLLGVPSATGTVALLENRQFFIRIGIPIPQQFDWVSQASILFGTRVEEVLVLIGVFGIPALGFIFGWWMGMHHSCPTQP